MSSVQALTALFISLWRNNGVDCSNKPTVGNKIHDWNVVYNSEANTMLVAG